MLDFYISYKIKAKIEGAQYCGNNRSYFSRDRSIRTFIYHDPRNVFMNSKVAKRAFQLPEHLEGDRNVAIMFANQGLYNGFLAVGLIWGLILGLNSIGYMVQLFFVMCVVVAALFGGFTSNKSIIVKQGLPAILALIAL